MNKHSRRNFIRSASAMAALGGSAFLSSCGRQEDTATTQIGIRERVEWKMVTAWPPNFPIFGDLLQAFADWISQMTNGNFRIQVYGGGELVPPFESFDAVSQGTAEIGHGAAYYWAGKFPAAQFFTSVPFGMNAQQTNAWMYYGGGIDLWKEVYSRFNLIPFPGGNTGGQMGGWFNKEINSISDFNGLKIRMPGLGGNVVTKAGATSILSPGGEIYMNLERGVIDAAEWIGPNHDHVMGFHKIAKYYYYPGWHEPSACCDFFVNRSAFENLPDDYKAMIETGAKAVNVQMLSDFEAKNSEYLQMLKAENVQLREFPAEVLDELKKFTREAIDEITDRDAESRKVYESYSRFQREISEYESLVERNWKP